MISSKSSAWSLKTHIWIAQQIINDITADGKLNILNQAYDVPPHIVQALLNHPDCFRMGCLGPDVFPDAIVGQTTTHPGVANGWQTDDWLKHLLNSAKSSEEIAFAYGYVIHSASDIFAHTYVNAIAGDIFVLTDSERDVELRHFVLEKYIEKLTPDPLQLNGAKVDIATALRTPASFLSQSLIMNGEVFKQNLKSSTGYHLASMYAVRKGVEGLDNVTGKLIQTLTKWGAKYYKLKYKFEGDLATAKLALSAAENGLIVETELLKVRRAAYQAALDELNKAREIVNKNPALISFNESLWAEQTKIAANLSEKALSVTATAANAISTLQNQISNLKSKIAGKACHLLGPSSYKIWKLHVPNYPRQACDAVVAPLAQKIIQFENTINGHRQMANAANQAAQEAANLSDRTKATVDDLTSAYNKAQLGLLKKTYQGIKLAAKLDLASQEKTVEKAKQAVKKAQDVQKKVELELNKIAPIIDEIKKTIDKYNAVTLLVQNWIKGIDNASEEYINASHEAGISMLNNAGNPLASYQKWYQCYGSVFMAVPHQTASAGCFVQKNLSNIKDKYQEVMDGLPAILRWMINPTKEASKIAIKKLEPELKKAEFQLLKFISDKQTAEFLTLLTNPQNATREKLTSTYSSNHSKKSLLLIPEIGDVVDNDLRLLNGQLNPLLFFPIAHSVTLAKLSLMSPESLNLLISNLTGGYTSPFYGNTIYHSESVNFTILADAVRSIDGNHQWQAYGLPYPRLDRRYTSVRSNPYGYNYYEDHSKGFRIWVDPYLREKVFFRLFNGPVMGGLANKQELKWPHYKFPECGQNSFPATQSNFGAIQEEDLLCSRLSDPNRPLEEVTAQNPLAYAKRYFTCSATPGKQNFSTIVASFHTKNGAAKHKAELKRRFPDLYFEVSDRRSRNKYFTVLMASCVTRKIALEARDLAIKRNLELKTFIINSYPAFQTLAAN